MLNVVQSSGSDFSRIPRPSRRAGSASAHFFCRRIRTQRGEVGGEERAAWAGRLAATRHDLAPKRLGAARTAERLEGRGKRGGGLQCVRVPWPGDLTKGRQNLLPDDGASADRPVSWKVLARLLRVMSVEACWAELRPHRLQRRLEERDGLGGAAGLTVGGGEVAAVVERVGLSDPTTDSICFTTTSYNAVASVRRPAAR